MKTLVLIAAASLAAAGCDTSEPTSVAVDNGFPSPADGHPEEQTSVYKLWWSVTLFSDPVGAGASSAPNRAVPVRDYAYALLAPGWAPDSTTPPSTLVAVRTRDAISVARGETGHITIAGATVLGDCSAGSPLSQEDADFITQRIFPGDFANARYDAARCMAVPITDADADGGAEDGAPDDAP